MPGNCFLQAYVVVRLSSCMIINAGSVLGATKHETRENAEADKAAPESGRKVFENFCNATLKEVPMRGFKNV
jgi:hypothetical protein